MDQLIALIVDEGKWLTASMGLALMGVAILFYRYRHSDVELRRRVLAAMNLFFAVTIGTMAFGHLLAVTAKLATGTLREGSIIVFYLIGIVLAVPSWWLIVHTRRILVDEDHGRSTIILNTWLAVTLLALGVPNLPLAAPALLNIGYHLHTRRVVGLAIVGIAVVINVGLFVGSRSGSIRLAK